MKKEKLYAYVINYDLDDENILFDKNKAVDFDLIAKIEDPLLDEDGKVVATTLKLYGTLDDIKYYLDEYAGVAINENYLEEL